MLHPDVGRIYESITNKIKEVILSEVGDNVEAILYMGSWARKEMSYIFHDDGSIEFLNDIDILVITNTKLNKLKIKKLRDKASQMLNKNYVSYEEYSKLGEYYNFFVEIRNISIKDLKLLPPRLKYYDIFHEPSIIYLKNKKILQTFPKIDINDIPLNDGLIHLFNRMGLLIEWNPYVIVDNPKLIILVLKSYTAIAEALTLFNKTYSVSYIQKAKNLKKTFKEDFPELAQSLPKLADRTQTYIDMKVNFYKYYNKITKNDIFEIWNNARHDILITTIYLINKIFGRNYELNTDPDNIKDIVYFLKRNYRFVIYDYIAKILRKKKMGVFAKYSLPFVNLYSWILFFKKYKEVIGELSHLDVIRFSLRSVDKDVTSFLYLLIFVLLSSMECNLSSDLKLDSGYNLMINSMLQRLNPIRDKVKKHNSNPYNIIKEFSMIFRVWELMMFEM